MKPSRLGFTLLELLIASSLFLTAASGLFGAARAGLQAWAQAQENLHTHPRMIQCLEQMAAQLRGGLLLSEAPWKSEEKRFTFVASEDGLAPLSVTYEQTPQGTLVETQRLLPEGEPQVKQWLTHVTDFKVSYGYLSDKGEGIRWEPSWEDQGVLPGLVQVRLAVQGAGGSLFLTKVVLITRGALGVHEHSPR
ncbi:MAG: type II secretion system protein [Elusimicrobia bacterium]|nr:type II secretion system protein [Elusimicrobiota bacterium]